MKECENDKNPAMGIIKILEKNKVEKEKITEWSELIVKGQFNRLKNLAKSDLYNSIVKEIFSNSKVMAFLEENSNYYQEISYFYNCNLSLKDLESAIA